jgi:SWIM zinc finger
MHRAYGGHGGAHRLYLIERKAVRPVGSPGGAQETFVVLGATRNVYEVTIGKHLKCTCPDFAKGNVCKHQLFVMLRVLKLGKQNPAVWQRALLISEVRRAARRAVCAAPPASSAAAPATCDVKRCSCAPSSGAQRRRSGSQPPNSSARRFQVHVCEARSPRTG